MRTATKNIADPHVWPARREREPRQCAARSGRWAAAVDCASPEQKSGGERPLPREAGFEARAVSPFREMGAYEALWSDRRTTFKSLSEQFARYPESVPSDFVPRQEAYACAAFVKRRFETAAITRFGICVHGAGEYPEKLQDAAHPVALLYYQHYGSGGVGPSVTLARIPSRRGSFRTGESASHSIRRVLPASAGAP